MNRRLIVLVALVAAAIVVRREIRPTPNLDALSLDQLPLELGAWTGRQSRPFDADVVAALGANDYVYRTYAARDLRSASVYVGYYRSQKQGASIHSPLNCLPGAGWEPIDAQRVAFAGGAARRVLIRKGPSRLLVLYWYQTATRVEGDEYRSRIFTIFDTIKNGRNDAALVRVIVPAGVGVAGEDWAIAGAADLAVRVERELRRVLFANAPRRL